MQMIQEGARGLRVLVDINWDRLFYIGTIVAALLAGAFASSLITTL